MGGVEETFLRAVPTPVTIQRGSVDGLVLKRFKQGFLASGTMGCAEWADSAKLGSAQKSRATHQGRRFEDTR